jgi:hypothetical protein
MGSGVRGRPHWTEKVTLSAPPESRVTFPLTIEVNVTRKIEPAFDVTFSAAPSAPVRLAAPVRLRPPVRPAARPATGRPR